MVEYLSRKIPAKLQDQLKEYLSKRAGKFDSVLELSTAVVKAARQVFRSRRSGRPNGHQERDPNLEAKNKELSKLHWVDCARSLGPMWTCVTLETLSPGEVDPNEFGGWSRCISGDPTGRRPIPPRTFDGRL